MKSKKINIESLEAIVKLLEKSIDEADKTATEYSSDSNSKYPYQVGYLEGTIKVVSQSLKELIK